MNYAEWKQILSTYVAKMSLNEDDITEYTEAIFELKESKMNQAQALHSVRSRQYIVGSVDETGSFSISATPAMHSSKHSADTEATRLAKANPGRAFIVLHLVGGSRVNGVETL